MVHGQQAGLRVLPSPVPAGARDRVARDHGVPLDEAIARADATKAFNFSDIDKAVQYHLRHRAGGRRCLPDGGGARRRRKAEPGAAVYARLLISRQNAAG